MYYDYFETLETTAMMEETVREFIAGSDIWFGVVIDHGPNYSMENQRWEMRGHDTTDDQDYAIFLDGPECEVCFDEVPHYKLIIDGDHFIDSMEYHVFDNAASEAESIYTSWMESMLDAIGENPTEAQIEEWNYMIDNCECYIVEYDRESGEYYDGDDAHFADRDELAEIGWTYWENRI